MTELPTTAEREQELHEIFDLYVGHTVGELLESAIMQNKRLKNTRRISALLAFVLLVAQTGALAHAYEHDPASAQYQFCATCIAGHAVGSGLLHSMPRFETPACRSISEPEQVLAYSSVRVPLARQRAPPPPL